MRTPEVVDELLLDDADRAAVRAPLAEGRRAVALGADLHPIKHDRLQDADLRPFLKHRLGEAELEL